VTSDKEDIGVVYIVAEAAKITELLSELVKQAQLSDMVDKAIKDAYNRNIFADDLSNPRVQESTLWESMSDCIHNGSHFYRRHKSGLVFEEDAAVKTINYHHHPRIYPKDLRVNITHKDEE